MIDHEHAISLIGDFQTDLGEVSKLLRSGDIHEAEHWVYYLRRQWHEKILNLITTTREAEAHK